MNRNLNKIYIALIFLIAVYIRISYVLITPFEFKIDAWSMYNYALNIKKGLYYGHAFGDYWARYAYWPPLYIFLSGFAYKFFGEGMGIDVMRLLQAFISALSCCVVYLVTAEAVKAYSRRYKEGALLAGLLMCINPRMIVYTNHLYVETVFIFLYMLAVYCLLKHYKYEVFPGPGKASGRPLTKYRYLAAGGVLLGLGNLTRPVILLVPFVMSALILLRPEKGKAAGLKKLKPAVVSTAAVFAIMLAVISPWTLRNYIATGKVILVDTNGPINFYIAHNPLANGSWVDVKPYTDANSLYETGYRQGVQYILQNPRKELQYTIRKQAMLFTNGDPHITENLKYLSQSLKLPFLQLPQASVAYLWLASGIMLFVTLLKLAITKKAGILLKEPAWIIGHIIYIDLLILAFYFMPRYRIIIEPFLICLIGMLAALMLSCGSEVSARQSKRTK